MKEGEMKLIAGLLNQVLSDPENEALKTAISQQVKDLCKGFPLPSA
jgi:glycine/serine hydroxymethyltransferase